MGITACVALTAISMQAAAESPSFDCLKTADTMEKRICGNPELARLDSQMSDRFRDAMRIPGTNREALLAEQRVWLRKRHVCLNDSAGHPTSLAHVDGCLVRQYSERVADLDRLSGDPGLVQQDQSPCNILEKEILANKQNLYDWNASKLPNLVESTKQLMLIYGNDVSGIEVSELLNREDLKDESQRSSSHFPIVDSSNQMDIYEISLTQHHLPDLVIGTHGGRDLCSWYEMFFRGSDGKLHPGRFYGDMCEAQGDNDVFVRYSDRTYLLSVTGESTNTIFSFIGFAPSGLSAPVCELRPFSAGKRN